MGVHLKMLLISDRAIVSRLADIDDSIIGTQITIEEGVRIDSFVKIKPVGGNGNIRIGKNSYVNSGVVIYSGNGVDIGMGVLIAPNCTLAPVNHEYGRRDRTMLEQRFKASKGGILIEDDVWIGANSAILDGAIIRKGAVIGACSLVNKEVEPYSINIGIPTKIVGYRE